MPHTPTTDPLRTSADRMKASQRRIEELRSRRDEAMRSFDDMIRVEQEHLGQLKARHTTMAKELESKRQQLASQA